MIQLIRVDDRLIHGQVAYSWKAFLNYDAIVIANDEIVGDEFRKSALKMCCPSDVKLAIRSIEDVSLLLNNEKVKNLKIFVIVKNIFDCLRLIDKNIEKIEKINIGGLEKKENSELFSKASYLTKEEKNILEKIKEKGIKIEFQLVPKDDIKEF